MTGYDKSLCACSCGRQTQDRGVHPVFFEAACRARWARQHELHPALTIAELKALRAGEAEVPEEPRSVEEPEVITVDPEPPAVAIRAPDGMWVPPRSLRRLLAGVVRRVLS